VTSFVLDNALTMAWCFADEATGYTESLLDLLAEPHLIVVPPLWRYEVVNVLLMAVRKNRIAPARAREFIEDLQSFNIAIDDGLPHAFGAVYQLADQHRLTSYDAAYLELAIRRRLPLATLDEELKKAASQCGVSLVDPR
jgi:predicted nucleic acid-binding protein